MSPTTQSVLNRREQYKARLRPYDYFAEFDTIDFESLGEGDRYYLQDFGIFNTNFLEDEFTIRLRNAGGRISNEQFLHLSDIAQVYNLSLIITTRGGFQFHDIEAENVREIWYKLNTKGLTSWQSFGDNIRNIVTDVYDGVNNYAKIEVQALILQMQEYILQNPKYVGMLPRRVSIGISGNEANVTAFFANDIYFALAKKEDTYGFNVYMGGKNTELAQDVDIFLKYEEVFAFFKAFVSTFYTHGSRFSRSKTRLFYMIKEIGLVTLKELIQGEYQASLRGAGTVILKQAHFEKFETLKDDTFSFRYETNFGKINTNEIKELALFAKENKASIRVGIDQNIYILGLLEKNSPFTHMPKSATILACAGNLCPYGVWSIKDETSYLPLDLIHKHQLKVGFSGCSKGCARHRHSDIGLIGLKTNNFGDTEGGARLFIGAKYSQGESIAKQLFSMVPFVHLKATLTLIIELFELGTYKHFQDYAHQTLDKYSEDFLALWYLCNLQNNTKRPLPLVTNVQTTEEEIHYLEENFHLQVKDMNKSATLLAKKLWTVEGEDHHYKPPIKRVKFR